MYQPGELIVYGGEGVCRVEAIGPLKLSGMKSDKLYYTLQPLYRSGTVFAPVEGKVFMRPVINRKQAEELVRSIRRCESAIWTAETCGRRGSIIRSCSTATIVPTWWN
jgi:CarD family transcriptional regulator